MLSPWREATEPPISTSASTSPSSRTVAHAQAHAPVGEVDHLVRRDGCGEPGPADRHALRVAGLLAAAAQRRGGRRAAARRGRRAAAPMRSFGPGRSCRIATGRPARPAASRTSRDVLRMLLARSVARSSGARRRVPPRPCERASRGRGRPDRWSRRSSCGARRHGSAVARHSPEAPPTFDDERRVVGGLDALAVRTLDAAARRRARRAARSRASGRSAAPFPCGSGRRGSPTR